MSENIGVKKIGVKKYRCQKNINVENIQEGDKEKSPFVLKKKFCIDFEQDYFEIAMYHRISDCKFEIPTKFGVIPYVSIGLWNLSSFGKGGGTEVNLNSLRNLFIFAEFTSLQIH